MSLRTILARLSWEWRSNYSKSVGGIWEGDRKLWPLPHYERRALLLYSDSRTSILCWEMRSCWLPPNGGASICCSISDVTMGLSYRRTSGKAPIKSSVPSPIIRASWVAKATRIVELKRIVMVNFSIIIDQQFRISERNVNNEIIKFKRRRAWEWTTCSWATNSSRHSRRTTFVIDEWTSFRYASGPSTKNRRLFEK